ncbi:MAG: DEAD/DEAH box helicase family protein [Candidatus Sericytochromatia bacterium]|nr:DEAD/DEAH box helicase family protein [Candidatus Sericytochromatia bacterium]
MSKTEAQTRKDLIDLKLKTAGWDVGNHAQVGIEFEIPVCDALRVSEQSSEYGSVQFSDYVLFGKDGKSLAIIEAKKTSKDAELGREQAKQYCLNLEAQTQQLPFCFYTNGHEIFFWDIGQYPPRKVIGFPTRDDLERLLHLRQHRHSLNDALINTSIAGRDYQIRAIRAVMEGIEKKRRDFLLVMATGTGKTRTCIALVNALMRAGHIERVLFLVDRIPLREQAITAFKEYLPNEPRWPKIGEKLLAKDRRIYVSTYPSMLNIIRDESQFVSPHFFDLVIIDESHRSIYNTYREILDYFKAINVGLTATPTNVIDHNTFKLFKCEDGVPTFAYTYEEAVNHNPTYLCQFQVMKIQTKFQAEGISKRTISLDDQMQMMLDGKEVEEVNFEGSQLEKQVTNYGTNALIVKTFMEEGLKDPDGVLPGKTIFFCVSKDHARRLEKIFDSLYPEYEGELAKVMVSDDPRVYGRGGLLEQFTKQNLPRIAISVDMLDTGIDVREIVNLVFAKPVYSYTKFWQMIGRGTRLIEAGKQRPWCPEKTGFLILDCWDNFDYFKLNPQGKSIQVQIPLPVRLFALRLDKMACALERGAIAILEKETLLLRDMIQALPQQSVVIQEAQKNLERLNQGAFWHLLNPEKLGYLRQHIQPLFRTLSQSDFKSMRFEKDVLELSLAKLAEESEKFDTLKAALCEQIAELPLAVNIIAKEQALIQKTQTVAYWQGIQDQDFDTLAEKLAPLMKFRERRFSQEIVKLELKDLIISKEMVEFGPEHESISVSRYREMVENLIQELKEKHPVLQKIKQGQEISEVEAADLAQALQAEHPHITEALLQKVYQNKKARFLQFIRHILGLEIIESFSETVAKAFEEFIQSHSTLTSRQLDFLMLLKEVVLEKEQISKRDLIQSPFTLLHPQGIRGLFSSTEINEIVSLTERLAA